MAIAGLDIGGAQVKVAWIEPFTQESSGTSPSPRTQSVPYALWQDPDGLTGLLMELLSTGPVVQKLAVTMTGELADCYASKREGVQRILECVRQAASECGLSTKGIYVWSLNGAFVGLEKAKTAPLTAAAANWHALSTWIATQMPDSSGLLVDMGSTTTDIIPFSQGRPVPQGQADLGRLTNGELVYTGARRTPLCALGTHVRYQDRQVPVAAELFATTLDLGLWKGWIAEDPHDFETADRRPATREASRNRLCHMLCCDNEELSDSDLDGLVQSWLQQQQIVIEAALRQVIQRHSIDRIITSGSGERFLTPILNSIPEFDAIRRISLSEWQGDGCATAACAVAVAQLLASEQMTRPRKSASSRTDSK